MRDDRLLALLIGLLLVVLLAPILASTLTGVPVMMGGLGMMGGQGMMATPGPIGTPGTGMTGVPGMMEPGAMPFAGSTNPWVWGLASGITALGSLAFWGALLVGASLIVKSLGLLGARTDRQGG